MYLNKRQKESGNGMQTGHQFQVGNERMTIYQIADRAKCSVSYARKRIINANEKPDVLIARMIKKHLKKTGIK